MLISTSEYATLQADLRWVRHTACNIRICLLKWWIYRISIACSLILCTILSVNYKYHFFILPSIIRKSHRLVMQDIRLYSAIFF